MSAIKKKVVIGDQTLILGDCLKIMPELGEPEYILSDPPYGMSFKSSHRAQAHKDIANDDDVRHLRWACKLRPSIASILFCRWDNLQDVPKPKSLITWVKNNHSMGDLSHELGRKTEVALFYVGPNHAWRDNRPTDVIYAARTRNELHPTQKPVSLMQELVGWHNGHVLAPFMGSGTTLVACAKLARKGTGIELDPDYFEIACQRVEEAYRQRDMFTPEPEQPVYTQTDLLDGDAA